MISCSSVLRTSQMVSVLSSPLPIPRNMSTTSNVSRHQGSVASTYKHQPLRSMLPHYSKSSCLISATSFALLRHWQPLAPIQQGQRTKARTLPTSATVLDSMPASVPTYWRTFFLSPSTTKAMPYSTCHVTCPNQPLAQVLMTT